MPIPRRIITVGGARYVSIPPKWIEYYEKKYGKSVNELLMELNGEIILRIEAPTESAEV